MTTRVIDIHKGFNEPISVGDSLAYNHELYVVIALKIHFASLQNWVGQCVIQKVGSKRVSRDFEGKKDVELTFHPSKKNGNYPHPVKIGDFIDCGDGSVCQAVKINKIYYRFINLVISYDFQIIDEWSNADIDKALQDEHKRKFQLIKGLGNDEFVNENHKPDLKLIATDSSNDSCNNIYASKAGHVRND